MNEQDIAYRKALGLDLHGPLPAALGISSGHGRRAVRRRTRRNTYPEFLDDEYDETA